MLARPSRRLVTLKRAVWMLLSTMAMRSLNTRRRSSSLWYDISIAWSVRLRICSAARSAWRCCSLAAAAARSSLLIARCTSALRMPLLTLNSSRAWFTASGGSVSLQTRAPFWFQQ